MAVRYVVVWPIAAEIHGNVINFNAYTQRSSVDVTVFWPVALIDSSC
jgi:hypothetical protein